MLIIIGIISFWPIYLFEFFLFIGNIGNITRPSSWVREVEGVSVVVGGLLRSQILHVRLAVSQLRLIVWGVSSAIGVTGGAMLPLPVLVFRRNLLIVI